MTYGTISEAIPASSSNLRAEPPSTSGSESSFVDSDDASDDSDTVPYEFDPPRWLPKDIAFAKVKISAFTETGREESSIKVPKQKSYTGRRPVIPSSLADTPCATLGIHGVLDGLNATLRTSYTLDTPFLPSVLEDCVEKKYDFGTAYGRLRQTLYTEDWSNIRDKLRRREEKDRKRRQEALVDKVRIVEPYLPPRRVWDLYSNRVVPWWTVRRYPVPISHAWVDEKDRVEVWTPINRYEWPVPVPKDACLDLIRIEMLNLGVEYMWLDVLCLRQKGGPKEDVRVEEWKLDVPTIGRVYRNTWVVIYLSGLGLPFTLKEGDLNNERWWFRRAWTLQEGGKPRIVAGDTPYGPLQSKLKDEQGNYETELLTRFNKQLGWGQGWLDLFRQLAAMQTRVSTNPVNKVAGLAFPLMLETIPAYDESKSLEDAWTALMNSMYARMRAAFLLAYPGVGLGHKQWRPTREQVMTETLPVNQCSVLEYVEHDDETAEDSFEGSCIEKGHVRGLDVESVEGGDRSGELVVEGADGMQHTFAIRATHQILIPEGTYTLLGSIPG